MAVETELSEPARLLLLASLLAKDGLISHNGKGFLKELILRRDEELLKTFVGFGSNQNFLKDLHGLIDRESRRLFDSLFVGLSLSEGKSLSKVERRRKGLMDDRALIYGEVDFSSFATILREVAAMTEPKAGGVFYDLGSGTGKAVFVARLTQDYSHCVGIEILRPLHSAAQLVTNRYDAHVKGILDRGRPQNAAVFAGSFLEYDWSDGDCVFANSTCFPEELMDALARQAEELKEGSILVTFTKGLDSKAFEVLSKRRFDMSWGPATVFIHRRCPNREAGVHAPHNGSDRQLLERRVSAGNPERLAVESGARGNTGSSGSSNSSVRPDVNPNRSVFDSDAAGDKFSGRSILGGKAFTSSYPKSRERFDGIIRGGGRRSRGGGEVGRISEAGRGIGAGELEEKEEDEEEEDEEEEEEGEEEEERGLLFDTEQLQGERVNGDSGVTPPAVPDRFMGFGELLRQAEQAQAQTLEQLNISREELLAMPDEPARTTGSDDGGEDDDDDDDDVDALHDLCGEGVGQERGGEASLREGQEEDDGETELDTEEEEEEEERDGDSAPTTMWTGGSNSEKGVQKENPHSVSNSYVEGGGESREVAEETREGVFASAASCEAATAPAAAETVIDAETGPASQEPQQQQQQESAPPDATPSTDSDEEYDQQAQELDDEEEEEEEEEEEDEDEDEESTTAEMAAAAVAVSTVGSGVSSAMLDDGSGGRCDSALFDDGSGDDDVVDSAGGVQDQQRIDAAANEEDGMPNDFGARRDGNPEEAVESYCGNVVRDTTESWPPPPPVDGGNDTAGNRVPSQGEAAALHCHWLPITLPPSTPSALGGGDSKDLTESLDRPLQAGRRGSTLSPVVEVEGLESPQDTALLKRKADRDPRGT